MNKRVIISLLVVVLLVAVSPAFAAEETHAASGPLDALGINVGFLVSQFINFFLVFGGLTFFLWTPATNMMKARSAKIQKGLEDAAAAANARRNAEAEAEKILAQARSEANQIVEQGRQRGEEQTKIAAGSARTEADRILADARTAAAGARDAELAGLRGQVGAISVAIAERLIGASMDKQRQQALISDFFTRVPADARNLSGDVTVVSAMPLDAGEQSNVKSQLGGANVSFTVDPSILGGLIIRAGDRVVDGSVRSGLNDISTRLG
jgi:F-type H+-transporting ATPase subunit b